MFELFQKVRRLEENFAKAMERAARERAAMLAYLRTGGTETSDREEAKRKLIEELAKPAN